MAGNPLTGRRYRNRRARILAESSVCGICAMARCPHCHGEKPHCGGGLTHIDHGRARSRGGPVSPDNEQAAHACCNLKKGDRTTGADVLRTSRHW